MNKFGCRVDDFFNFSPAYNTAVTYKTTSVCHIPSCGCKNKSSTLNSVGMFFFNYLNVLNKVFLLTNTDVFVDNFLDFVWDFLCNLNLVNFDLFFNFSSCDNCLNWNVNNFRNLNIFVVFDWDFDENLDNLFNWFVDIDDLLIWDFDNLLNDSLNLDFAINIFDMLNWDLANVFYWFLNFDLDLDLFDGYIHGSVMDFV